MTCNSSSQKRILKAGGLVWMLCKEVIHLASAVPHPVHKLHGRGV